MSYIEREAALLEIEEWADTFCECDYVWPHVIKSIRKLPAADVRPVVRGKWVSHDIGKGNLSIDEDTCSVCGSRFYQIAETGCEWKFCPNCGAVMREEQDGR